MLNNKAENQEYLNYRWFLTSDKKLVVGGKSDSQNELAIKNFLRPQYTLMHTTLPGSPFMIILSNEPSKKDIEETAIVTGCFSQQWKIGKKDIEIDIFKGENVYKTKIMKIGTFGVKGGKKTVKINPELFLVIQRGKLRAVPKTTKEKKIAKITQGKMSKEEAANKIADIMRNQFEYPVSKDEIMQAIPSDKLSVSEVK